MASPPSKGLLQGRGHPEEAIKLAPWTQANTQVTSIKAYWSNRFDNHFIFHVLILKPHPIGLRLIIPLEISLIINIQ